MATRGLSERAAALEARLSALEQGIRDLVRELKNDRAHMEERLRRLEDAVIRLSTRGAEVRWLIGLLVPVIIGALVAQVVSVVRWWGP
jgi:predicted nuclease with TOPRIM domain